MNLLVFGEGGASQNNLLIKVLFSAQVPTDLLKVREVQGQHRIGGLY